MRTLVLSLAMIVSLRPAAAQFGNNGDATFQPRFQTLDRRVLTGECKIRVRIDNEAEVIVFDDEVRVRVVSGHPATDAGSECTSPLPRQGVTSFEFRKTDGPGEARLLRRPDERNGQVAIFVRDGDSGDHKYTLEFRWTAVPGRVGDSGDRVDDRFPGRSGGPRDFPRDRDGDRIPVSRGSAIAMSACSDEVRMRIREDGFRDPEITRAEIDNNPGRRDSIEGEAIARRGRGRERFNWECNVDLASGRVRNVRVRRD
jgi:hypothetical protein